MPCTAAENQVGHFPQRLHGMTKQPNAGLCLFAGGYRELFPVQAAAWRETAGGRSATHDLCICAPTGSGKTLAYALPIVAALSGCASS